MVGLLLSAGGLAAGGEAVVVRKPKNEANGARGRTD
jgi:hypothetical protein